MKRVGVVLAGCGYLDGAEIQEAVAALLALDRRNVQIVAMAPDREQLHVVDHATQDVAPYNRNVLKESARITRGEIHPINSVDYDALDAVVFPGGFGAAKNLCNFATEGVEMRVIPEVRTLLEKCADQKKPMAFICIAPVIAAAVLGKRLPNLELTIGNDVQTSRAIEHFGATHITTGPGEIHVDMTNKIVTTPAYMIGPDISAVFDGIDACIAALMDLL